MDPQKQRYIVQLFDSPRFVFQSTDLHFRKHGFVMHRWIKKGVHRFTPADDDESRDLWAVAICRESEMAIAVSCITAPDNELTNVYVSPSYRGRGIGTATVTALLDFAARKTVNEVFCWPMSDGLGRFYEKFGFVCSPEDRFCMVRVCLSQPVPARMPPDTKL